jgi:hypothetical protein
MSGVQALVDTQPVPNQQPHQHREAKQQHADRQRNEKNPLEIQEETGLVRSLKGECGEQNVRDTEEQRKLPVMSAEHSESQNIMRFQLVLAWQLHPDLEKAALAICRNEPGSQ